MASLVKARSWKWALEAYESLAAANARFEPTSSPKPTTQNERLFREPLVNAQSATLVKKPADRRTPTSTRRRHFIWGPQHSYNPKRNPGNIPLAHTKSTEATPCLCPLRNVCLHVQQHLAHSREQLVAVSRLPEKLRSPPGQGALLVHFR